MLFVARCSRISQPIFVWIEWACGCARVQLYNLLYIFRQFQFPHISIYTNAFIRRLQCGQNHLIASKSKGTHREQTTTTTSLAWQWNKPSKDSNQSIFFICKHLFCVFVTTAARLQSMCLFEGFFLVSNCTSPIVYCSAIKINRLVVPLWSLIIFTLTLRLIESRLRLSVARPLITWTIVNFRIL